MNNVPRIAPAADQEDGDVAGELTKRARSALLFALLGLLLAPWGMIGLAVSMMSLTSGIVGIVKGRACMRAIDSMGDGVKARKVAKAAVVLGIVDIALWAIGIVFRVVVAATAVPALGPTP